jgi:type I restriction enzyme R subunit
MPEPPEQRARREIDAGLTAAGWLIQDRDDLDLTAGRGIAVGEFRMKSGFGFADYLLYVDARLKATQSLRRSILRHALTGKLVPQDPAVSAAGDAFRKRRIAGFA